MTGTLWLPSLGTGAQFVIGPGRITDSFEVPLTSDFTGGEEAMTGMARAIHRIAEVTGPPVTPYTECEARRFDDYDGGAARIEVCLYDRRAA